MTQDSGECKPFPSRKALCSNPRPHVDIDSLDGVSLEVERVDLCMKVASLIPGSLLLTLTAPDELTVAWLHGLHRRSVNVCKSLSMCR